MKFCEPILMIAGTVLFAVLAFGVFLYWSVDAHPVSQRKLAQLQRGLKPDQVRDILGAPYQTYDHGTNGFHWIYGNPYQWHFVRVEFSSSSNVVRFVERD